MIFAALGGGQADVTKEDPIPTVSAVVWFEVYADDVDRAAWFYERAFGWSTRPFTEYDPSGGYLLLSYEAGARSSGAIVRRPQGESGSSSGWNSVLYIEVEDVAVAIARVEAAGGTLIEGTRPIGGNDGVFSLVRDSEGNVVGLWSES